MFIYLFFSFELPKIIERKKKKKKRSVVTGYFSSNTNQKNTGEKQNEMCRSLNAQRK